MQKMIYHSKVIVFALFICLLCSVSMNFIQYCMYFNQHNKNISIIGTYCTDETSLNGNYIVFDQDGYFCTYVQLEEISEIGHYVEIAKNQYSLSIDSTNYGYVLISDSFIYVFTVDDGIVTYHKIAEVPTFISVTPPPKYQ